RLCARRRKVVESAPLIPAHDEDADGRAGDNVVVHTLEPVLVPLQCERPLIDEGSLPEIHLARAPRWPMTPGAHHQLRAASRHLGAAAGPHAGIPVQRSLTEDVEPTA